MLSVLAIVSILNCKNKVTNCRSSMWMENYEKKDIPDNPTEVSTLSHDIPSSGSSMSTSSTDSKSIPRIQLEPSTSSKIFPKGPQIKEEIIDENSSLQLSEDSDHILEALKTILYKKDECIKTLQKNIPNNRQLEANKTVANLESSLAEAQNKMAERDSSIVNLAKRLSDLNKENAALKSELRITKLSLKPSSKNVETSTTDSFQSQTRSSTASPVSLTFSIGSQSSTGQDGEVRRLRDHIKKLEMTVAKLKDMNMQWQSYNDQRDEFVKSVQTENEQLKQEVGQLKEAVEELSTNPRSTGVLEFTPAQQEYIDGVYQKLRAEADRFKEKVEITAAEGRRNLEAERKLREEAEKTVEELGTKVTEQESKVNQLLIQSDELRSALVVATRTQEFSAQEDQELTINNLREAVRLFDNTCCTQNRLKRNYVYPLYIYI